MLIAEPADIESFNLRHYLTMLQDVTRVLRHLPRRLDCLIAELADIESFNLKHYLTMLQPMHTSFGSLMRETRASCGFEQAGCVAFHINI